MVTEQLIATLLRTSCPGAIAVAGQTPWSYQAYPETAGRIQAGAGDLRKQRASLGADVVSWSMYRIPMWCPIWQLWRLLSVPLRRHSCVCPGKSQLVSSWGWGGGEEHGTVRRPWGRRAGCYHREDFLTRNGRNGEVAKELSEASKHFNYKN